ncbi:D-alanine--D-alanine ligase [Candidatus Sumerlaeota bacterium]|nr:D-alanine--D-alanine ligase [Candidatus Sumerlaeota bacterium]
MTQTIGILFGGRSGEHEVSVQSALNIQSALDKARYRGVLVGIDRQGEWRLEGKGRPLLAASAAGGQEVDSQALAVIPVRHLDERTRLIELGSGRCVEEIDVFFPIAHGTHGEDGCLQGLLRLLDAPFVGAGVLGSAVGMDKDVMKRLLRDAGVPIPRFVTLRVCDRDEISFDVLAASLGAPFFVKPCNLGSSVGIAKVSASEQFEAALDAAFAYDTKVLVEEYVPGREIECSVLGNDDPRASIPGEIVVNAEFYSYKAKYVDEDGAALAIPAPLNEEVARAIRKLAIQTFQVLECEGMARVDFFLKEDGAILVNEINTLPGFTKISMYPNLWEATGIGYSDLLDRLIGLAVERHARDSGLKRTYGA